MPAESSETLQSTPPPNCRGDMEDEGGRTDLRISLPRIGLRRFGLLIVPPSLHRSLLLLHACPGPSTGAQCSLAHAARLNSKSARRIHCVSDSRPSSRVNACAGARTRPGGRRPNPMGYRSTQTGGLRPVPLCARDWPAESIFLDSIESASTSPNTNALSGPPDRRATTQGAGLPRRILEDRSTLVNLAGMRPNGIEYSKLDQVVDEKHRRDAVIDLHEEIDQENSGPLC